MIKILNKWGKPYYEDATEQDEFSADLFYEVPYTGSDPYYDDKQWALHTNLGSITVLDRMTGFGWRDVETGFRAPDKRFWLASGNLDVRISNAKTLGEAIAWIKLFSNNCKGD